MIQDIRTDDIRTDLNRFQNRTGAFSERSVDLICANFDERLMQVNPITVWKDTQDLIWLLAGHSRLEAHRRLEKPTIKAAFFEGTEAEAIEYARNSNNLGSRETYLERLRLYREKYAALGYEGIREYILQYEDKRSLTFLLELLHLNPDGLLLNSLAAMMEIGDQTQRNTLESIASMIGRCRIDFADKLTHEHENEMFRWLLSESNFRGTNKGKFLGKVKGIVGGESFSKTNPLNLAGLVHKAESIKRYEQDEQALISRLSELDKQINELHNRLMKPNNNTGRAKLLIERNDLLATADALRLKLSKHRAAKSRYEEAALEEYDMFNPPPMQPIPKQTTLKQLVKSEKQGAEKEERTKYTLNGVATEDTDGMVPISELQVGNQYKRKNKPTYKAWTVLAVNGNLLTVTSGENNVHTVKTEKNLLVYRVS